MLNGWDTLRVKGIVFHVKADGARQIEQFTTSGERRLTTSPEVPGPRVTGLHTVADLWVSIVGTGMDDAGGVELADRDAPQAIRGVTEPV
jgi:hypothetical protein